MGGGSTGAGRGWPLACAAVALGGGLLLPTGARGASYRLEARAEGSLSAIPSWPRRFDDPVLLGRDPLVLRLDFSGDEMVAGEDLQLATSVRVGTDLGWRAGEAEALDGVERHRAEALFFTVRWKPRGLGIELLAGRQLQLEAVRPRYFDGGTARYRVALPASLVLRAEAFAGRAVKDGSPLAVPTFEADGVRSSDAALAGRVDAASWPFVLTPAHAAPALLIGAGAGLRHAEIGSVHAGVEQTRSAGSVDGRFFTARGEVHRRGGSLQTALAYDLVRAELSSLDTSLAWRLRELGQLSLYHRRFRPTFDGDSIWNLFVRGDRDTTGVGWRSPFAWPLKLTASFHLLRLTDPTQKTADLSLGGRLGASGRLGPGRRTRWSASATVASGYGGTQALGLAGIAWKMSETVSMRLRLAGGFLDDPYGVRGALLSGRASLAYRFDGGAKVAIEAELNHSPLSRAELRVFGRAEVGLDAYWGGRE